jgi:hypothetical protein
MLDDWRAFSREPVHISNMSRNYNNSKFVLTFWPQLSKPG